MILLCLFLAGMLLWTVVGLDLIRVLPSSRGSLAALSAQLTPAERRAILAGRVRFLDGGAACRLAASAAGRRTRRDGRPSSAEMLVILNTPAVFRGAAGEGGDGRRVLAITRAAVLLGARLLVDCTDADLGRLTPAGWRSVLLAKRAKLWRMVVFDGAHHVASLAADPEMLLLPLLTAGGQPLIVHGYVRDALPVFKLRQVLAAVGTEPLLLSVPRFPLSLKQELPLRLVVLRVLRQIAAADQSPRSGEHRPGGRLPLTLVRFSDGVAELPQGIALTGRSAATMKRGLDGPLSLSRPRQTFVAVSYGNFSLAHRPGLVVPYRDNLVAVGWPLSVWDLLLLHPLALAGQALPW